MFDKKRETLKFLFEEEEDFWREAKSKVDCLPEDVVENLFKDERRDHLRFRARKFLKF